MKTLTRDNADRLLLECADIIRAAGDEGLEVATLDEPIDHYLAGVLSMGGRVALVWPGPLHLSNKSHSNLIAF